MVASLERSDGEALKTEIARQQTLDTSTSNWLEIVGVQCEARDAYTRQKALWLHLGSTASWSRYSDVSIRGRAAILQCELDDSTNRLGPLYDEVSGEFARQQVRAARIARLLDYDSQKLLCSFTIKGRRPVMSIPDIDDIIMSSRLTSTRQKAHLLQVERAPKPLHNKALKTATEEAITDIDSLLIGMLAR